MTLQEYQTAALKFVPPVGFINPDTQLGVWGLGLIGEATEVLAEMDHKYWTQAERDILLAEIGDCFWYMVVLCHHLNIPLPEVGNYQSKSAGTAINMVLIQSGIVSECIKKHIGHKKVLDLSKIKSALQMIVDNLQVLIVYRGQSDLDRVLEHNIQKLTARYPNGFVPSTTGN